MYDEEFYKNIRESEVYHFCFEFRLNNQSSILLTSASQEITIHGKLYRPFSGLSVKKHEKNDVGLNSLYIEGYFEQGGIEDLSILDNSEVIVSVYSVAGQFYNWIKYYFRASKNWEMKFELEYLSSAHHLQNIITKTYSTTCRAQFGDKQCGVDKTLHPDQLCDKTISMCCNKYKNAINFRGEPFLPTLKYYSSLNE